MHAPAATPARRAVGAKTVRRGHVPPGEAQRRERGGEVNQMLKLYTWVVSHLKSEEGAAMVEYGLLVAGIAVLVMAAVWLLGGRIDLLFREVLTKLA